MSAAYAPVSTSEERSDWQDSSGQDSHAPQQEAHSPHPTPSPPLRPSSHFAPTLLHLGAPAAAPFPASDDDVQPAYRRLGGWVALAFVAFGGGLLTYLFLVDIGPALGLSLGAGPSALAVDETLFALAHETSAHVGPAIDEYSGEAVQWAAPCLNSSAEQRCTCLSPRSLPASSPWSFLLPTSWTAPAPSPPPSTTCLLPPPVLLSHYYALVTAYLPHVLTYRPSVDCQHGRYLFVRDYEPDGLGSALSAYNTLLDLALVYRLQIVDFPFAATHIDPAQYGGGDPNHVRRARLKLHEWHVSRQQFEQCGAQTAVVLNRLHLGKLRDEIAFEQQDDEHKPLLFTQERAHDRISSFVRAMRASNASQGEAEGEGQGEKKGQGFTVYFDAWKDDHGCTHRTGLVHAIRAAVDPIRTRERLPLFAASVAGPYLQVGVHVRRGDLTRLDPAFDDFQLQRGYLKRVIGIGLWTSILTQLLDALAWSEVRRMEFTLFAEGGERALRPLQQAIIAGQRAAFARAAATASGSSDAAVFDAPGVRMAVDLEAVDTTVAFAQSDVVLTSPSDFSYAVCMLHPQALKVGVGWITRWHGCINHFQLSISRTPIRTHHPGDPTWVDEADVDKSTAINITQEQSAQLRGRIQQQMAAWQARRTRGRQHDPRYPFDQQLAYGLGAFSEVAQSMMDADLRDGLVDGAEAARGRAMLDFLAGQGGAQWSARGATYDYIDLHSWWQSEGITIT